VLWKPDQYKWKISKVSLTPFFFLIIVQPLAIRNPFSNLIPHFNFSDFSLTFSLKHYQRENAKPSSLSKISAAVSAHESFRFPFTRLSPNSRCNFASHPLDSICICICVLLCVPNHNYSYALCTAPTNVSGCCTFHEVWLLHKKWSEICVRGSAMNMRIDI